MYTNRLKVITDVFRWKALPGKCEPDHGRDYQGGGAGQDGGGGEGRG